MRLWHYEIISYLPNSQLLAQWRELNSIFKKQDKHILINYIYEYDKTDLYVYTLKVINEMKRRGITIKKSDNYYNYFIDSISDFVNFFYCCPYIPFVNHHNDRYLLQCFYNLQEKYDRGQKDFTNERYDELENFMKGLKLL